MANKNSGTPLAISPTHIADLAEIIGNLQIAAACTDELYIGAGRLEIRSGNDYTVGTIDIAEDGDEYTFTPVTL